MKEIKEFRKRAEHRVDDMDIVDRKLLAKILEEFERRLTQVEKDTDPHWEN